MKQLKVPRFTITTNMNMIKMEEQVQITRVFVLMVLVILELIQIYLITSLVKIMGMLYAFALMLIVTPMTIVLVKMEWEMIPAMMHAGNVMEQN